MEETQSLLGGFFSAESFFTMKDNLVEDFIVESV